MELITLIEEGPKCPKCKMKMVKRYKNWASYRVEAPWYWWCGCGYRIEGGIEPRATEEQQARANWQSINGLTSTIPANEGED